MELIRSPADAEEEARLAREEAAKAKADAERQKLIDEGVLD